MLKRQVSFNKKEFHQVKRLATSIINSLNDEDKIQSYRKAQRCEQKISRLAEVVGLGFEEIIDKASVTGGSQAVKQALQTVYRNAFVYYDQTIEPLFTPESFLYYKNEYRSLAALNGLNLTNYQLDTIMANKLEQITNRKIEPIQKQVRRIKAALQLD